MAGGVEYQVTKVDPTNPETKGMVYQVHKVTEEVAATLGGKVYRARIIKDPTEPTVAGKVYQIVLIGDPDDPSVKGKVYNAILTGDSEVVVVGPAVSPLTLPDAIADSLSYVKAFGGTEQRNLPDGYIERQFIYMMDGSYIKVEDLPISAGYKVEFDFQTTSLSTNLRNYLGGRVGGVAAGGGFRLSKLASSNNSKVVLYGFEVGTEYYDPTAQFQANTRYKYTYDNGVCTLESGGSVVSTKTFTVTDNTSTDWVINGYINGTYLQSNSDGIYVYSVKVWNTQGELVMDLVPAVQRGTVPVVGFYDTVSKTFKTATDGTFAAGGEAVPTPDAPMDIISNNGVLKARHQSGLPTGYTLLDYIESTGTQYINTGYFFTDVATETVTTDFMRTSASSAGSLIYGFRDSYKVNGYGIQVSNNGSTYMQYGAIDNGLGSTPAASMNTRYTITQTGPTYRFRGASYTSTGETPTQNYPLTVFAINNGGAPVATNTTMMRLYGMTIKDANNVVKMNLVPVKRSDNVLGVFDTVSGQFFTNQGTDDFIAGTAVSDSVEIYTDGTVETINVHGKNLFDKTQQDTQYYYGNDGSNQTLERDGSRLVHSAKIPCKPNTTYTLSGQRTAVSATAYYKFTFWDANGDIISYENGTPVGLESYVRTATTPNNCYYIAFNSYDTDTNVMLERGSTATDYEPYYDGGTATAEMLLKVGDYQDVQSIIDGVVTRNVGVKVLDGSEGWRLGAVFALGISNSRKTENRLAIPSTHYVGTDALNADMPNNSIKFGPTSYEGWEDAGAIFIKDTAYATVDAFKQYLADQYAAGTPVIVLYPLAEPTTESVAGQTLQVTDGDNTLEITQASLSGLELEAEYEKEGA